MGAQIRRGVGVRDLNSGVGEKRYLLAEKYPYPYSNEGQRSPLF